MVLPTTSDYLRHQGRRTAGREAIVYGDAALSYAELADAVDALAHWLAARGVGAGLPVGIMAGNNPAMVALVYAAWGLGAVPVPISMRSTADEVTGLLVHAHAAGIVADAPRAVVATSAAAGAGVPAWATDTTVPLRPRVVRRGKLTGHSPRRPSPTSRAAIAYTAGSSGTPKGVVLTHENVLWATLACAQARGDTSDGVGACMGLLTHVPVLVSHLLCRVLLGARAVLFEHFDVPVVLEAVTRWGITDLPLIGGMVHDVAELAQVPASAARRVQKVSVGGAPTPMTSKRRLGRLFPDAELIEAYGQTEATDGVLMSRGRVVLERVGTVGRMNPHVHVAIHAPDGTPVRDGDEGEIVIGGPTVMRGYHRDRAATRTALRDGWLHTGDVGRRDGDGYFYLTGRMKELIITGGENVAPLEVEEVLRAHPDVEDVAVIGMAHPRFGEQVTAVVVRRQGATADAAALTAFAGERLAGFKKPRRVEFVDALPRNAYKKVEIHALKRQLGG